MVRESQLERPSMKGQTMNHPHILERCNACHQTINPGDASHEDSCSAMSAASVVGDCEHVPWRDKMMPEAWYQQLDPGIRFPVRVLHAQCLLTSQSCQGGEGHSYQEPTVDLVDNGTAEGMLALAALGAYGLDVMELSLVWDVQHWLPHGERIWRVTLRRAWPERADDKPNFVYGVQAR